MTVAWGLKRIGRTTLVGLRCTGQPLHFDDPYGRTLRQQRRNCLQLLLGQSIRASPRPDLRVTRVDTVDPTIRHRRGECVHSLIRESVQVDLQCVQSSKTGQQRNRGIGKRTVVELKRFEFVELREFPQSFLCNLSIFQYQPFQILQSAQRDHPGIRDPHAADPQHTELIQRGEMGQPVVGDFLGNQFKYHE